jgi:ATP-dependent Lon protease
MLYHENFNAEYGLTLQYLEWLTNMPWGIYTKDSYDIEAAQSTSMFFF